MTDPAKWKAGGHGDDAITPSTDSAVTNPPTPGLAIDTTGPAAATAGELITYNLVVTNTGNTVFDDGMLVLTDDRCQAPPALLSRNGDASPVTLSPGESWTYSCQVATFPGQQQIDNSGSVTGTDQGGRQATATDVAGTALAQPASAALPATAARAVPGSARLRGTVGCATAAYALATVSGKRIESVTYYVNGKKVRTLTKSARGALLDAPACSLAHLRQPPRDRARRIRDRGPHEGDDAEPPVRPL